MEFDKQFVHCVWDESLVGKLCVFADDIPALKIYVERHDFHYIAVLKAPKCSMDMDTLSYPFFKDADAPTGYRFVYYDPNLQCKIAHEQGKQIQYFDCEEWLDVANPTWLPDTKYRIKPEPEPEPDEAEHTPKTRRMTNRELSRWLAEGKGERVDVVSKYVSVHYVYSEGEDNEECDVDIKIRAWDENEWHEPLSNEVNNGHN